jgi:flagellar biosynthetic protein FlhB
MSEDNDQKTEQPSEKRLNDAIERGQIAKSPELVIVFSIAGVLLAIVFTTQTMARDVADYAVATFTRFAHVNLDLGTASSQLGEMMLTFGRVFGPVLIACVGAVLLAGAIQNGFQLAPKAVSLKWNALDPMAGFGRMFGKAVVVRAIIDLLKLIAIASALWLGARALVYDPLFSTPVEAAYLGEFIHRSSVLFFTRLIFALGIVAAINYSYEKFKTGRDLMMTRQEVKDEHKNSEGDAHMKAARRRLGRRLVQKQMLAAVATADVVITNPTHYAVALKYERGQDRAPVVLAKGENRFAQRLKAIAAENGVPMVENKPVARLLFAVGKVGAPIPAELYQAVASILAVVYRTHRFYFHQLRARRLAATAA